MEFNMNKLKEQAKQVAKAAQKTAAAAVDTGKTGAKLLDAQNKQAKAERQLGQLVYSLKKSGEENDELIAKYVETIDELKASIEALNAELEPVKESAKGAYSTAVEKATAAYNNVKASMTKTEEEIEEEVIVEEPAEVEAEPEVKIELPVEEILGEVTIETKKCPKCGAEVAEDTLFCDACGAEL